MSIVLGNGVRGCTPFEYDTYYDKVVYIKCRSCDYEWIMTLDDYTSNRPDECPVCHETSYSAEWALHNTRLYEYKQFKNLQNLQLVVELPKLNLQGISYGDPGLYTITAWAPGVIIPGSPDEPDEPEEPDPNPEPEPGQVGDITIINAAYSTSWLITHNLNSLYVEAVCHDTSGNLLTPVSVEVLGVNAILVTHDNQRSGTCTVTVIEDPNAPVIPEVGDMTEIIVDIESGTWIITHNLNTESVEASCFDIDDNPIIPISFTILDVNTIEMSWNNPIAGKCVVTVIEATIPDEPEPDPDEPEDPTGTICAAFSSTVPTSANSFDESFISLFEMIVTSPKLIQVYQDNRTNFSYPPGMPQNVSGHNLIIDENKVWYDCGIPDDVIPGEGGGDSYDATQDCLDAWDNFYSANLDAEFFDEAFMTNVENTTSPFEGGPVKIDVYEDTRTDKFVPETLIGDMSYHRIIWTANGTWHDCGVDEALIPEPDPGPVVCPDCPECFEFLAGKTSLPQIALGPNDWDNIPTYANGYDKAWNCTVDETGHGMTGKIIRYVISTNTIVDCGPYQALVDGYFGDVVEPDPDPVEPDPDPEPIEPPEPEPDPLPLWIEKYVLLDSPQTMRDEGMFHRDMLKVLIHNPKEAWNKAFMFREVVQASIKDYIG